MTARTPRSAESRWARLGVLLNAAPAPETPDLERLLLDTARALPGNARLFPLVLTWLVEYGNFVARHRLRRLTGHELQPAHQPALGLLLASALQHGAPRDLALALEQCRPAVPARPLFDVQATSPALGLIAEGNASALSRQWGVWAPETDLKRDAIRPVSWVLARNPGYHERIVRKGDLRCSILETLRIDAGGRVRSESELARLSGATRAAVRKALAALVQEGAVSIVRQPGNDRDLAVVLGRAA